MPDSIDTSKSFSNQLHKSQPYNDRMQDWLLDPGLDLQGRLLTGRSAAQPQSPTPPKQKTTKSTPKAHI
ncbi:hypothetical protein FLONG3_10458 [Fusarium longipes]|uniref:Uncharacterized protein n=1 Tax=Fusarium longipes TaxID=694270 RepID=A0A395RP96_9HYPO|nr:hypothetical protein FLONG3_10458 [Fusarium longipes]